MGREKVVVDLGLGVLPGPAVLSLGYWFPAMMAKDYVGIAATVYVLVGGPILIWRWWVINKPQPMRRFKSFHGFSKRVIEPPKD